MTRVKFATGSKGPSSSKARAEKKKQRRFKGSVDEDNLLPDVPDSDDDEDLRIVSPSSILAKRMPAKRSSSKRRPSTAVSPPSFVVIVDLRIPSPASFEVDARLTSFRMAVEGFLDAGRRRRWLKQGSFLLSGATGSHEELTAMGEAERDEEEATELKGYRCHEEDLASGPTFELYNFLAKQVSSLSLKTRTKRGQRLAKKVRSATHFAGIRRVGSIRSSLVAGLW